MNNKKKTMIISTIIILLLLLAVGGAYAFFTYENGTKSDIVTGQIYMNYEETSTISLTDVFPETKAQALARQDENGVFEFTITGRNTSKYPVYYEIDLLDGGVITGKTEESTKILPEHVMIYLEKDGVPVIEGETYADFNNRRIYVETVPANQTSNIEHKYVLRMWIDENVTISDTDPNADYTTTKWNDSYASLKVRVVGDFEEKNILYNYMIKDWGDISGQKSNITEVHFVSMEQDEINTRFDSSTIKKDVTDTSKSEAGSVLAWLETNEDDTTKYTMYVASDGITLLPSVCNSMFYGFSSATTITFDNVNTKNVSEMRMMFWMCSGLTSLDIGNWDTSSVSDMSYVFADCSSLTSLEIGNWDTSNVSDMDMMFDECSSLTSLNIGNWDTSNVECMSCMFYGCSLLTSLEIGNWDTSSVSEMSSMFNGCSGLTSLEIGNWDTSSVVEMYDMFRDCSSLTSLNIGNWDISNVYCMASIFNGCSSLTSLDIGNWDTSNVSDMLKMFRGCSSLMTLNISNFTFDNVTHYYSQIFYQMKDRVENTPTIIVKNEEAQNWILDLDSGNRPSSWTVDNVVVKPSV